MLSSTARCFDLTSAPHSYLKTRMRANHARGHLPGWGTPCLAGAPVVAPVMPPQYAHLPCQRPARRYGVGPPATATGTSVTTQGAMHTPCGWQPPLLRGWRTAVNAPGGGISHARQSPQSEQATARVRPRCPHAPQVAQSASPTKAGSHPAPTTRGAPRLPLWACGLARADIGGRGQREPATAPTPTAAHKSTGGPLPGWLLRGLG